MYDLTGVLTTIAAASGSLVAILGGFIASKLISISGEREEVTNRLREIEGEIQLRYEDTQKRQQENNEDDALDFIIDKIRSVCDRKELDSVYEEDIQQSLSFQALQPYWNQALVLLNDFLSDISVAKSFNADGIPQNLATKVSGNRFKYKICKAIANYLDSLKHNNIYFASQALIPITGGWYTKNREAIEENSTSIKWLKYQAEQLEIKRRLLKAPKGMRAGLCIFAVFTITCIILPLCFSPYITENYQCYLTTKIIFLFLFVIGLSAIFGYLIYLLKWKEAKKEHTSSTNSQ